VPQPCSCVAKKLPRDPRDVRVPSPMHPLVCTSLVAHLTPRAFKRPLIPSPSLLQPRQEDLPASLLPFQCVLYYWIFPYSRDPKRPPPTWPLKRPKRLVPLGRVMITQYLARRLFTQVSSFLSAVNAPQPSRLFFSTLFGTTKLGARCAPPSPGRVVR